jgi:hypothetical protein
MFGKNKSPEEKIKGKIKSRLSKKAAAFVNDNLRKCLEFATKEELPIKMGDSKVGGNPHLAIGQSIPLFNGKKLKFICQLNCADFNSLADFPHSGILYFFLDLHDTGQFPNKSGQWRVLYSEDSNMLSSVSSDPIPDLNEERLVPVPYYSIPDYNSYVFEEVDLSDEEKNELIDIKFGLIPEVIGDGGLYKVDIIPDPDALYDWSCQYLRIVTSEGIVDWEKIRDEAFSQKINKDIKNMQKDWVTLFQCTLDYFGYPDSWIHIGIHKNDLRALNFEKAFAAYIFT